MDVRRAALIACIASVIVVVESLWDGASRMAALGVTGSQWWVIPAFALLTLFSAIMPVFYFALYRYEGTMRFARPLRKLALGAAVTLGIVTALRSPAWAGSWNPAAIAKHLANFTYILLLVSMSRDAVGEQSAQSASNFLSVVTKVAVVTWSVWVAFQLVRLAIVEFTYSSLKTYAYQVGHTPPTLRDMAMDVILTLFSQASLLAAPYIVWQSGYGQPALAFAMSDDTSYSNGPKE
jgi:hypothetical protein